MGAIDFKVTSIGKTAKEAYEKGATIKKFVHKHLTGDWDEMGLDKWGPCGCICLGRNGRKGLPRGYKVYVFFGWAST